MSYFGLFNINKPTGLTSRRVVDHVQRLVRPAKAGHAGTLDPLASGVLVVGVGPATRLIDYVQRAAKRYTATFLLGRESDTEDVEGIVKEWNDPPKPTLDEIQQAAKQFVGETQQRPPAFSALKVKRQDGRSVRAYELARSGKSVVLKSRPVTIYEIQVQKYEYPELTLDVRCGSGVYVRSLGRDLAASLCTAAVMSALVRTEIGMFHLASACELDVLTKETIGDLLLPARLAVDSLPAMTLTDTELDRVRHGMPISRQNLPAGNEYAALDADGLLAAILKRRDGALQPVKNFFRDR